MKVRRLALVWISLLSILIFGYAEPVSPSLAFNPIPPSPDKESTSKVPWQPETNEHVRVSRQEGISSLTASATDRFGYTRDDTVPFAWVDATHGTVLNFQSSDDSSAGPVEIGFPFKFYENIYTQLFVSTNGILTFGKGSTSFRNDSIPQDTPPNNMIAPFWDDLAVGGGYNTGKVYYTTGTMGTSRYLAVEWYQITRRVNNVGDLLTFEALLFENGDILFQYQDLIGVLDEATVGIEDGDGYDGLLYLYASPGLSPGKALRFIRPAAAARIKILPAYQSGFALNDQAKFSVVVRNTGEMGNDTYDLNVVSSAPGWKVTLFAADQVTPLTDSDQDTQIDTGPLGQGESITLTVKCRAPEIAQVGDYTQVNLTAKSSKNPAQQASAILQSAISAPFAQAFADSVLGLRLSLNWQHNELLPKTEDWFSGSTLAVAGMPSGNYIYAWERSDINEQMVIYFNIEYALVSRFGRVLRPTTKLTDNQGVSQSTRDRLPSLSASPGGRIGVVWVREISDGQTLKTNSNVFFALLDANGNLIFGPVSVTSNPGWRGETDLNVPLFVSPRVTAVGSDRFVIAWTDQRLQNAGETSSISYAIYNSNGGIVKPPASLAANILENKRYFDPALTGLSGNRALAAYTIFNRSDSSYTVAYTVFDQNGDPVRSETSIPGGQGWGPDAVQLSTGKILLAWTDPSNDTVTYTILNNSDYAMAASLKLLVNPNPRQSDYVSVTLDKEGHGILTWMDSVWNYYLYYALVDDAGTLLTPPMIFYTGQASDPIILSSYSGQGNAPYDGSWQIFLPLANR